MNGDRTTYTEGVDTDPNFNYFDADADGLNDDVDPLPDAYNYNDGDPVPLSTPDGLVNAADYMIAARIVMGKLTAAEKQLAHGDVCPPGLPDGVISLQDITRIRNMALDVE